MLRRIAELHHCIPCPGALIATQFRLRSHYLAGEFDLAARIVQMLDVAEMSSTRTSPPRAHHEGCWRTTSHS
ncbi:hypothetical protein B0H12DRAFT_1116807 [Mycena haematopus]|nr:hypothetical protein B0H12DRAFT_1116807 [Mycena haematopus]